MDVCYQPPGDLRGVVADRPFDMWRYRELLPLPAGAILPPIRVGGSPVSAAPRLAEALGVRRVVVKDDGRNPSASTKDRPSAVAVVLATAAGKERVVCASTGNAASSLACLAASLGLGATIFVPARAPAPKVAQLRVFGARVLRVAGDYDTTWELCQRVATRRPWFNRNCAVNPYLVEGKKTIALELADQLRAAVPAWVAVSVGDGCTYAGVVKGLEEAHAAGFIPFVPRVLGVQAEGARPLVDALDGDGELHVRPAETVADSIAVGHPRNFRKALDAARRNGGRFVAVTDAQILAGMRDAARLAGVFAEPAAAAAVAGVGVAVARGIVRADEDVAVLVTGNGLKDTATALTAVDGPEDVAADEGEIERVLG
ncbi:MAG: threonine synthase [Myxococcota bacterium]